MKLRNTLILVVIAAALGWYAWTYERGEAPDPTADRSVVQLAGFAKPEDVTEITVNRPEGVLTLQRVPLSAEAKKTAKDAGQGEGEDDWKLLAPIQSPADKNTANAFVRSVLNAKATSSYTAEQAKEMSATDLGLAGSTNTLVLKDAAGKTGTLTFGKPTVNDDSIWTQVQGADTLLLFTKMFVQDTLGSQKVGDLRDKTLLAVAASEVRTINLDYPAGGFKLERGDDDTWQLLLADRKLPADRDAVDNLLASIVNAKIDKFVDAAPKAVTSYGLDKPRVTITLGAGAKGEMGLQVGSSIMETAETPDPSMGGQPPTPTEKVYIRRKGDTEVLQVPGSLYAALIKTPQDFRDKTILAVNPLEVTKLSYTIGAKAVEIVRQSGPAAGATVADGTATWQLVKPQALAADAKKVGRMLDDLRSLMATGFIDEPGDLAQYGLAQPLTTITVEQGGTVLPKLLVGKAATDGSGTFFKLANAPLVYRANASLLGSLETKPERLRQATVLKLDRTLIKTIELRAKGRETVTLTAKGANEWEYVTAPATPPAEGAKKAAAEPKKADAGRVAGLLTELEEVRGDEWITDAANADLAKYGLKEPDVTVVVTLNDGAKHTLLIGRDPATNSLAAFAKAEGQPLIVRNDDGTFLQRFVRTATDLEPLPEMPMGNMPMGMPM